MRLAACAPAVGLALIVGCGRLNYASLPLDEADSAIDAADGERDATLDDAAWTDVDASDADASDVDASDADASDVDASDASSTAPGPFTITGHRFFRTTLVSYSFSASAGAEVYTGEGASDPECMTSLGGVALGSPGSASFAASGPGTFYVCVTAINSGGSTRATPNPYPVIVTPGIALGQVDATTSGPRGGPTGQSSPLGSWTDGTRLAIADTGNHRVLIWNAMPTSPSAMPDLVLGQPDFDTVTPNTGGISASSMQGPITVHYDGSHFIVCEYTNNRVLVWSSFPTMNGQPADIVVGQGGMGTNGQGTTQSTLNRPSSAFSDGVNLYVTDDSNHRILLYTPFPLASGENADVVLGQGGSFTSGAWDGVGATASSIDDPSSVWVDAGRLIVTDSGNNRVLVWDSIPSGQVPADLVLGQPDFMSTATNNMGPSARSLGYPTSAMVYDGDLWVADRENHRVLRWDGFPTSSFAPAAEVFGQPDSTTVTPSTGGVSASSMNGAQFVSVTDDLFIVSEMYGNRTLLVPRQ